MRKPEVKSLGLTRDVLSELRVWRQAEAGGIPGVEVKFVEIWRNTGGEGGLPGLI